MITQATARIRKPPAQRENAKKMVKNPITFLLQHKHAKMIRITNKGTTTM